MVLKVLLRLSLMLSAILLISAGMKLHNYAGDVPICDGDLDGANVVYVRLGKVGSTTVTGVLRHIIHQHGRNGYNNDEWITSEPGIFTSHKAYTWLHEKVAALKEPTLLITWIRKPVEHCFSQYYFSYFTRAGKHHHVNSGNEIEEKLQFLEHCGRGNASQGIRFLATKDNRNADWVFDNYNFIGLTERFEESMLLLAYQYNLSLCDIMYLKAKDSHSGQVDDTGAKLYPHPPLSKEPIEIQNFLSSEKGRDLFHNELQELAERVDGYISASIEKIGADRFNATLAEYMKLLQGGEEECGIGSKGSLLDLKDCYFHDSGCGHTCLDTVCLRDIPIGSTVCST